MTTRSIGSSISVERARRRAPGHRLAGPVDRVRGAAEAACEDVAEELAADRSAARRRADDGHGRRLEERSQRRGDGDVVALVDALLVARRRLDREPDLDDAAVERPRRPEADVLEDGEHAAVLGQHLRDERLDPALRGALGQLLEQPRADPLALLVVGDGEGGLGGARIAQPHVVADRDDRLARRPRPRRRSARPARPSPARRACARTARRPRRGRGSGESGSRSRGRRRRRRAPVTSDAPGGAEPERRAVTEDDVDRLRIGQIGHDAA